MMFSSKAGWHLPFALLAVAFLLYVSLGVWFTGWVQVSQTRPPHALDGILSPESIDTLYQDARFHDAILELTETIAKASLSYGERLESDDLKDFGKILTEGIQRTKATAVPGQRKRQLVSAEQQGGGAGGLFSGLASMLGIDGNGTNSSAATSLANLFQQGLSGLSGSVIGGLATPAYFLGIGLGIGAENGLNLTTSDESKAIATTAASASGQQPTGINLVAQNLGTGLGAQLVPALGNLSTSSAPIGLVVFSLAQGIGQGSASALNLTAQRFPPTSSSDITSIAKNFGLGITGPLAGSLGMQKLLGQTGRTSGMMAQIPQIAAAAGKGLGEGASRGLGLNKNVAISAITERQQSPDSSQMGVPGFVGNLTLGLSQAFFESSNLSMITQSGGGFTLDSSEIMSLAAGAGKGIGEGIAVGLRGSMGNNTNMAPQATGDGTRQEEQVAQQFTKNLVTSLFQSGGIKAIGSALTSQAGNLTAGVDAAQAAEGAARGLVEGSISALSEAGGLEKVLKGDFPKELATNLPVLPKTQFDDSLNGSVVAFARGLSGEGVLLISQMFNMEKNVSGALTAKRSINASGVAPYHHLSRRAEIVALANDDQILHEIAQFGVDSITCSGVGGIAAFAMGIMQGNSNSKDSPPLELPKETVTIMNDGNIFTVNLDNQAVTINGRDLKSFATITIVHVVFCTLAFFFALPAYLALGAIWRFSDMIGQPIDDANMKKWRSIILLCFFTPLASIGIILGMVGKGSAAHFRTAHSVFGLLTLLSIFPSMAMSAMRLRTAVAIPPPPSFFLRNQITVLKGSYKIHTIASILTQLTVGLGIISWILGFSDLRSISLCVIDAVLTAPLLAAFFNAVLLVQMGAISLLIARCILERRIASSGDSVSNEKSDGFYRERSDTIKTFGFDPPAPEPSQRPPLPERRMTLGFDTDPKPNSAERPPTLERNTSDLVGKEDSGIGWPSEVRWVGGRDTFPARDSMGSNPFIDPRDPPPVPKLEVTKRHSFAPDSPVLPPSIIAKIPAPKMLIPPPEGDSQIRRLSYASSFYTQAGMDDVPPVPALPVSTIPALVLPRTSLSWDRDQSQSGAMSPASQDTASEQVVFETVETDAAPRVLRERDESFSRPRPPLRTTLTWDRDYGFMDGR